MPRKPVVLAPIKQHFANLNALNLKDKDFKFADLSWSTFGSADLTNADFSNAILTRCSFKGAVLRNTIFRDADLTFADFRFAIIDNANFAGANLMWAHLCNTSMLRANLKDAKLDWSCLIGSQLSEHQASALPSNALFVDGGHKGESSYANYQAKKQSYSKYTSEQNPSDAQDERGLNLYGGRRGLYK